MMSEPDIAQLREEAERIRHARLFGRSAPLARLFDFLLETSIEGRLPKEIEIAQDALGKGGDFDSVQDASVRVHAHRLRRKLDEFYAADGSAGSCRLYIPKGEYRLGIAAKTAAATRKIAFRWFGVERPFLRWSSYAVLALCICAAAWAFFCVRRDSDGLDAVRRSPVWSAVSASPKSTFVVVGDYYIFGQSDDGMEIHRLVREFNVNSASDLERFVRMHPEKASRAADLKFYYLPTGSLVSVRNIVDVVAKPGANWKATRVIPMSDLAPSMIKSSNIVYLGYLSGLGLLREPLFAHSRFRVGASYDELIDQKTGTHYEAEAADPMDADMRQRDFAYIASFPGPLNTRVIILAGTRDAGMMQASDIATDAAALRALEGLAGEGGAFEALYQVESIQGTNVGSKLMVLSRFDSGELWRGDNRPRQIFPDDLGGGRE